MKSVIVQDTDIEPVSLANAKQYASIITGADDVFIASLISAARKLCEDTARVSVILKKVIATACFPFVITLPFGEYLRKDPDGVLNGLLLPKGPLFHVDKVSVVVHGVEEEVVTDYIVDAYGRIHLPGIGYKSQGSCSLQVEYWAGYGTDEDLIALAALVAQEEIDGEYGVFTLPGIRTGEVNCPDDIKLAILDRMLARYQNRGEDEEVKTSVISTTMAKYKKPLYMST